MKLLKEMYTMIGMKTRQIIPDGWMVRTVKQFGKVVSGGTPDTNNCSFWGGDIFWLTPSEVSSLQNRYIYRTKRTITKGGLDNSSAMLLPKNSLILCTRATIGDCCINAVEMCTNQGFKNIIVNKDNNVEFLYYLVLKNKNELLRKACGSTFLEISKKDVEKLKFIVPPLEEQEKIAQILAAWDSAIEQLTDLIAEKQHQKKALMQRLLTGKQRFPGFNKPWKNVRLGEISDLYQPQTISQRDLEMDGYPVYGANGLIGYYRLFNHETWQIMITCRGSTCGTVNRTYGKSWITGNAMVVNVDKYEKNDKQFLFFKLLNENFLPIVSGSGQPQIVRAPLKKWKIYIPADINEQKAIADVLMAADAEIDLLQQKLQAITEQKQGLMQQLLTGNIRVKIDKK